MEILAYQDWMRPQVVKMFVAEYGGTDSEFEKLFLHFYESAFQKDRCIRIVAVEGDVVGGFQSFFYWPLSKGSETIHAWQSGNSLVHPEFRGRGLFAKMLDYIHLPESGFNAELLIGFPVEMSYNSFIRNKWKNPFDLKWFIKLGYPIRSLLKYGSTSIPDSLFPRNTTTMDGMANMIRVEHSKAFDTYRFAYQKGGYGRCILEEEVGAKILVEFKIQIRKKIIRELVIGKVIFSHTQQTTNKLLFAKALRKIGKELRPSLFSIAINEQFQAMKDCVVSNGFKQHEKKIYFIAKGKVADSIDNWDDWDIQRADIDTW
jgi:GNAT superfamily N-acetyltransferase